MYKLEYYVPADHVEAVNRALFDAGAGRIGQYEWCCWMTAGTGQFRPLATAHPFIGEPGQLEQAPEMKVEMVLDEAIAAAVIAALRRAHPYETPAYQLIHVE